MSSNIIAYLDEVKQINFPFRFDKLDATVSNINQAIQNLQGRLESAVKDIREDVTVHSNDMKSKLKYSFAEMVSKLDETLSINIFIKNNTNLFKIILFLSIPIIIILQIIILYRIF